MENLGELGRTRIKKILEIKLHQEERKLLEQDEELL